MRLWHGGLVNDLLVRLDRSSGSHRQWLQDCLRLAITELIHIVAFYIVKRLERDFASVQAPSSPNRISPGIVWLMDTGNQLS